MKRRFDSAEHLILTAHGLVGTASISNYNISGGYEYIIKILNNSGTLNRLTVNNTDHRRQPRCRDGQRRRRLPNRHEQYRYRQCDSHEQHRLPVPARICSMLSHMRQSNMDVVFQNNNVSNNHANQAGAVSNVLVFSTSTGNVTYDISNNTIDADTNSANHNTSNGIAVAKGVPEHRHRRHHERHRQWQHHRPIWRRRFRVGLYRNFRLRTRHRHAHDRHHQQHNLSLQRGRHLPEGE